MILLDSCAVLDIIFDAEGADELAKILDYLQTKGEEIVFLKLTLLESSTVIAIRYKEKKICKQPLSLYLEKLATFQTEMIQDDLSQEVITEAAMIKSVHAASMVDCYLIANARLRQSEIITADQEILRYDPSHAKTRKLTQRFSGIMWVPE